MVPTERVQPAPAAGERLAGCDLGKSAVKLLTGRLVDGALVIESTQSIVHDGRPFEVFAEWYRRDTSPTPSA